MTLETEQAALAVAAAVTEYMRVVHAAYPGADDAAWLKRQEAVDELAEDVKDQADKLNPKD